MIGHRNVKRKKPIKMTDILFASITVVTALATYYIGFRNGRVSQVTESIEYTLDFLKKNNMIRYRYNKDNEIELLDIDGNETSYDKR